MEAENTKTIEDLAYSVISRSTQRTRFNKEFLADDYARIMRDAHVPIIGVRP